MVVPEADAGAAPITGRRSDAIMAAYRGAEVCAKMVVAGNTNGQVCNLGCVYSCC